MKKRRSLAPVIEAIRQEFTAMTPLYLRKPGDKRDDKIKPGGTPVGNLDVLAQKRLENVIRKFFPDDVFIAEEDKKSPKEMARILADQKTYQWTIDGLDGTGNRSMRLLSFGAMLALREGNRVILAVLFRPADEKLTGDGFYYATERGAFNWRGDLRKYERIHTAKPDQLERMTIFLEGSSKKFGRQPTVELVKVETTRGSHSTCVAGTTVARGDANAYVCKGNKVWDVWPVWRLIESAGGVVTDFLGKKPTPDNCSDLIGADNKSDSKKIIRILGYKKAAW